MPITRKPRNEAKVVPSSFNKYKMSWLPAIQKVSQQKSGMEWNAWLRPLISSLDLGQQACPFHSISFLFFAHINNIPVVGLSFDLLVKKLKFYGLPVLLGWGNKSVYRFAGKGQWNGPGYNLLSWQFSGVHHRAALTLINYADYSDISGATNGEVEQCGCDFPWRSQRQWVGKNYKS